jgi:hypothetical protein
VLSVPRSPRRFPLLTALALAMAPPLGAAAAGAADAPSAIARGDAAWQRRADGARDGRAAAAPITAAVAAYEEALRAAPGDLEAHWKLMRALWFQGEYAAAGGEAKQRVFGRGKEVAESAMAVLARRVGERKLQAERAADRAAALRAVPEAAPLLLWSAANWGLWGDAYGKLAAARQGVGAKVRDWGETLIALDPGFENAGGHRVLGRLHSEAPRVPLFTGWVDHERGITELERAVELAPSDLANRLYLAEALLDHRPAAKTRAVALLREVAAATPAAATVVEDAATAAAARRRLAAAQ